MATFHVFGDVGVHARPVLTKKYLFICLLDAVVASEEMAVCIEENIADKCLWQENYHMARFELLLNSLPNNVIFKKTII